MCMDRPPLPLPDRDPGFGQIPTKPVDTALIRAARSADVEAMRILVEAGADPKLPESRRYHHAHRGDVGPRDSSARDRRPRASGRARCDRRRRVPARARRGRRRGRPVRRHRAAHGREARLRRRAALLGRPRRELERRGQPGARRSTTRSAARPRCSARRPRAPRPPPRCASSARAKVLQPRR